MDQNDAIELWSKLGEEGKAPTDLTQATRSLPTYTVGFEPWIDRLARRYLRGLCRRMPHFKLALAPYGGGKTHFLLALGVRARSEDFAVAYVPCGADVSLDKPLDMYREVVKHLQLPSQTRPGLRVLLDAVARNKRADIQRRGVPDPEGAFQRWATTLRRADYPENAFGRVISVVLAKAEGDEESPIAEAAFRWLQGDPETLTRNEMAELRLARVPAAGASRFGRDLLLSLIKFLPEAGVHGLVLLIDEVETLFATSRGKALLRVLAAMRVLLDIPAGVPGGVPLFGVFSATPDVTEEFDRYPALAHRLAVHLAHSPVPLLLAFGSAPNVGAGGGEAALLAALRRRWDVPQPDAAADLLRWLPETIRIQAPQPDIRQTRELGRRLQELHSRAYPRDPDGTQDVSRQIERVAREHADGLSPTLREFVRGTIEILDVDSCRPSSAGRNEPP